MFSNLGLPSTTLPPGSRHSSPALEPQLPRGECGFLLPEGDSRGARQRCSCRSFFPSDDRVKSLCGCGHQAWHHESQPLASVSVEEHMTVVQELQKMKRSLASLEGRFAQECKRHADVERTWNTLHQKQYQNMKFLKIDLDDKVESVMDKSSDTCEQLVTLTNRLDIIDDLTMELENRIERVDPGGGRQSRSLTPVIEAPILERSIEEPMHDVRTELPFRSFERRKPQATWTARVVFIPRKSQRYVPLFDSVAMRRCLSRGLQQEITFSGSDSASFINTIETYFRQIIRGRSWMPLIGYRPEEEPFGRIMLSNLTDDQLDRRLWNHAFIDDNCIAHDKLQGDLLYIALMNDDLSWTEIKWLSAVPGSDDGCWQHDEELDGPTKGTFKSLDEQMMYDYAADPPPYSSRTQSEASRRMSGLDVLANTALRPLISPQSGETSSLRSYSERSMSVSEASISAPSVAVSDHSLPASSLDSVMSDDDLHRSKKIRTKASIASMLTPPNPGTTAPALYVSGRSKRKLSTNAKVKEPLHINVAGWAPIKTIRSMHGNKDKSGDGQTK